MAGNQWEQRATRTEVSPDARHEYFPGLDGLRAIAVVAVLFFHAGVRRVPGGFLGVSLFFTLSGFLITGLLIDEFSANGRIALRSFWGRRIRRLMPAALLCLALVLIASRWLVDRAAISSLRADVVAAAADVANWRFVTAHQSYADLFAHQPSALLHFWSLAIEEQFYLVFPCVVAVLASRRRPWLLPVGLLGLLLASVSATLMTSSHDTIYYGTHTRAAELLVGGLLAWFVGSRATVGSRWGRPSVRLVGHRVAIDQAVGFVGLGLFALFVVTTRQADAWLYRGGFVMLALLWCLLIVAARANGPFCALVSLGPLVALGRRSYGVYLFHWPVFVLLTASRLGVHGWQARMVQLAIIAAVTEVSYRFVERPIRLRRILVNHGQGAAVAFACFAAVIVSAVVLPAPVANGEGSRLTMLDAPDEVVHLTSAAATGSGDVAGSATTAATTWGQSVADETPTTWSANVGPPLPVAAAGSVVSSVTVETGGSGVRVVVPVTLPGLNVLVVGSSGEVPARVRVLRGQGYNIDVTDSATAGCPVITATGDAVGDGACIPDMSDRRQIDVLVIGITAADHVAINNVLGTTAGKTTTEVYAIAQNLRARTVDEFERLGGRAGTVVVVDDTPSDPNRPDFLDQIISEARLSTPSIKQTTIDKLDASDLGASLVASSPVVGPDSPVPPSVPSALSSLPTNAQLNVPMKVMVIGDSTSFGLAQGLADSTVAPFDVVWAGKRNCPLARMESIRWLTGDEFSMADCPSITSVWRAQVGSFRPDVILVLEGLPEESAQRYAGDPSWHEVGDPQFIAVHDADFLGLLDLAASIGAVVVLADQPHNAPDASMTWASGARIDAWNAQLETWDQQWSNVAILPYASAVESAEAAAGHTLRPDGLHLDAVSVASIIGGVLAPTFAALVTDLRASLIATGCLIPAPPTATLDLSHCR